MKPWPVGQGKVEWARRIARMFHIDLAKSKAYGDSDHDIPLLKAVGIPLAVDPNNKLKRIAHERSWEILSFK